MLNILLLCNKPKTGNDANTIVDHIEAIEHYSSHTIWLYSNLGDFAPGFDLNKFDVVIIHYSISLLYPHFLSAKAKAKLRDFNGLKVAMVQDEYRQINKMISQLQLLKVDVLMTCFPEPEMEKIYNKTALPDLSLYSNLTGFVPERLLEKTNLPLTKDRPRHIGYRGRKIPFWLGELAFEKWDIVEKWKRYVKRKDIQADLSYHESERIYGHKWLDFILSCKATLGVESGASVMDFTGDLEKIIDFHQLTHPKDDFYTVQQLYLKDHEGKYKLNQISPRCFEAIALKTVLVLYEGEYSNILTPGRHYIVLKKDYSNIKEVVDKLLDDDYLQNMADTAYNEIALNPEFSYKNYIARIDSIVMQEFSHRELVKNAKSYTREEFAKVIKRIPFKKKCYNLGVSIYSSLPSPMKLVIKNILRPSGWPLLIYSLLPSPMKLVIKNIIRSKWVEKNILRKQDQP